MSLEPVDFYIKDSITGLPVPGVVLKLYDQNGVVFYQQGYSDADGHVGFLLTAPITYQARFYKFQTGFTNPQLFQILEAPVAPASNIFDITSETQMPPVSSDIRFCTASGFFRLPNGDPHNGLDMMFIPQFDPILLEGAGLLAERIATRTDRKGFVRIDLIRCACYQVTLQGYEDQVRYISVPDAPSVNLPDLLFPVVTGIVLSPAGPYTLPVGSTGDLVVDVTIQTTGGGRASLLDLEITTDNQAVAAVVAVDYTASKVTLRGLGVGVTNINFNRRDKSIIRIPSPALTGSPVQVTVT